MYHQHGVKVIACARQNGQLGSLKEETGGDLETIHLDISDWSNTRSVLSNLGPIDGLVNNAGVAIIKPFGEFTEDEFDK